MKTKLTSVINVLLIVFLFNTANAQTNTFPANGAVGIGTTSPNSSSLLEIKSTTKGVLIPRMTKAQRDAIVTPATGLLIYQTNGTTGFYYYNGSAWNAISTKGANASLSNLKTPTAVNVNLLPDGNSIRNLGSSSLKWKDVNLYNLKFNDATTQTTAFVPYTPGTGISISGTNIINTTPDKTVALSNGTGITVTGAYPNFTITNSKPDKTVVLNNGTGISVTGTYPTFTVSSTISQGWSLTGNAGTDSSVNFLGTTDAHNLVFRVGNLQAGLIEYSTCCSGKRNTAFGLRSLFSNTIGTENTATGYGALYTNISGNNNSAFGKYALFNNNADDNTALGFNAMFFNTTGNNNTATGSAALQNNTASSNNTANGWAALYSNNGGNRNTAVGATTLNWNVTGNNNVATGYAALNWNNGDNNTAAGAYSLYSNTTGYSNIALGVYALYSNKTRSRLVAIGDSALYNNTGSSNTAIGSKTLFTNTTGSDNSAMGYTALYANLSGSNNTATGSHALTSNSAGSYNTAQGGNSLGYNVNGSNNTATGASALLFNQYGNDNTGVGMVALSGNTNGSNNTGIGSGCLSGGSGNAFSDNTAIGYKALYFNEDNYNTAAGYEALYNNITGYNNTALGIEADVSASNLFNATAIGANAKVNANNKIRLGDAGITVVESAAGSWTTSDGRFKSNIKENVKGLEFIKLLKPVTYNFDAKKYEEFLVQNSPDSIKEKRLARLDSKSLSKASNILQSGFIAQDVAAAAKKISYDFNGVHAPENPTDNWSLSYEKLVVPLVKAVQELSAKNDDLQKQIDELKALIVSNQSSVNSQQSVSISSAFLSQNIPNPFTNSTTINYALPQKITSAQIVITDKSGTTLKAINIAGSKGNIKVDASTLAAGAYQYSLMVDGRLIDTKQMILAK
ncbi:MAG TPA: tail fiber domain-containing protein [Parafilimonas sp.]|nr:tail fiber domain-containing protein [Parafilimonas sp.]